MTREELQNKFIDIGGHCAICELLRIVEWIINNKEEIPEKEKPYGRNTLYSK